MGAASSCCHQEETLGDILPVEDPQKVGGYNTHQKIIELKAYRFFLNHLITSMLVNNGIEKQDFYFIRKSWIQSWAKYTGYEHVKPLLIKNEINNEIDFHKIILDHKRELNFEGFIEKNKPGPIRFFEINKLNTNIKENFYIFDSKILKQFIDIYEFEDINNAGKEAFVLKGEVGKGRIIFDVKEYTLMMFLNKNWEIKQIMVIFGTVAEHKHFVKSVSGRALTFISKELKKIVQKKKMITYKRDDIFIYDNRDFIKYEYANNKNTFNQTKSIIKENKENEQQENKELYLNKKFKKTKIEFDKLTNLFEPITKEDDVVRIKDNIKVDKDFENVENDEKEINNEYVINKENNIIIENNNNKDKNIIDKEIITKERDSNKEKNVNEEFLSKYNDVNKENNINDDNIKNENEALKE